MSACVAYFKLITALFTYCQVHFIYTGLLTKIELPGGKKWVGGTERQCVMAKQGKAHTLAEAPNAQANRRPGVYSEVN